MGSQRLRPCKRCSPTHLAVIGTRNWIRKLDLPITKASGFTDVQALVACRLTLGTSRSMASLDWSMQQPVCYHSTYSVLTCFAMLRRIHCSRGGHGRLPQARWAEALGNELLS